MGHDKRAAGGEGQLKYHIIVGIGKKWPPVKENILMPGLRGQITQESQRVGGRLAGRQMLRAYQHVLPFGIKGNREANLKTGGRNGTDQSKARSAAGMRGGDENRSVNGNAHDHLETISGRCRGGGGSSAGRGKAWD
jgi:hypothetical protein